VSNSSNVENIPWVVEEFIIKQTYYVEHRDTGEVLYEGTKEACFHFVSREHKGEDAERLKDGIVKYPKAHRSLPVQQFDDAPDVGGSYGNYRDGRVDGESDLEVFPYPHR
jgi:hypothetical protein